MSKMLRKLFLVTILVNCFILSLAYECVDPNAVPGCDENCQKRCPYPETVCGPCPEINSCECKEGLFYDTVSGSCGETCRGSPGGKDICPEAVKRFIDALRRVSIRFLKSYADANPCKTGTVSALATLSITLALGRYAKGQTKNEIFTETDVKSIDEIDCIGDVLSYPAFNLPDCVEYRALYGIFGNEEYQFTPGIIRQLTEKNGQIGNFDFSKANETADAINAIAANITNNKIPIIIEDSSIFNSSTQLVSVNAWSFKSEWEIEFQSGIELEFKISPTESALAKFLYQDAVYLYGHSKILGAEVAKVNFCCGSNFYLWVIVPDCLFTESALIDKMNQNMDWYYEIKQVMKPTRLDLYLFSYNKSTTVDSKALLLDTTNIKSLYNNETINLKGAIECDKPAALSYSIQKTYVTSSPRGGPVPNGPLSNGAKKTFMTNSPHVYLLFREEVVYFTGVVRGPIP